MNVTSVSARPVGNNGGVGFGSWNLSAMSLIVGTVALVVLGVLAVVFVVKRVWVRNAEPQQLPMPQPQLPAPSSSEPRVSSPQPPTPSSPQLIASPTPVSVVVSTPPPTATSPALPQPLAPPKPESPQLTAEHLRVIAQYKARIHDVMTLSSWDLRPGSEFDKQIDALEASAQPVILLTGLVYTFRTDEQTRQHLETLLKPCAMVSIGSWFSAVPDPTDLLRITKKTLFISKFVERTKRLFTDENTSLRQTAIRELGLDETTVNTMHQAIESTSSSTQSVEGEKFFRYFLTGINPLCK